MDVGDCNTSTGRGMETEDRVAFQELGTGGYREMNIAGCVRRARKQRRRQTCRTSSFDVARFEIDGGSRLRREKERATAN